MIAFVEYPVNTTLVYPMEREAIFRCRLESGDRVDNWLINGSDFLNFIADLSPSLNFLSGNGTITYTLSITVAPEHNGTQVACVATVNGTLMVSPNATLTIIVGMH